MIEERPRKRALLGCWFLVFLVFCAPWWVGVFYLIFA